MRISQLSIDTLRRSIHLASQCVNKALAAHAPSSNSAPQASQQRLTRQPSSLQQEQQQEQQQQHGIVIRNRCPVDLLCRQVGTGECLRLPADTSLQYCWHTPPGMIPPGKTPPGVEPPGMTTSPARLLCIASMPPSRVGLTPTLLPEPPVPEFRSARSPPPLQSSLYSPAVLEPKDAGGAVGRASKESYPKATVVTSLEPTSPEFDGKSGSSKTAGLESGLGTDSGSGLGSGSGWGSGLGAGLGQDAHLLQSARAVSALPWSKGFDCMSSHSCQLRLQLHNGGACTLAVSVHKVGLHWQVVLQPICVLLNKAAAAVHLHYTGELLACKARRAGVLVGAEGQRERSPEAGSSFALEPEAKVGDGTRGQSCECRAQACCI